MSLYRSFNPRRLVAIAAAVAAAGGAALATAPSGNAESSRVEACTVAVGYNGVSLYAGSFLVSAATPFVDDRSTTTREDVFTATLAKRKVTIDYFKDVSVFDFIDVSTTANLDGAGRGTANGSSMFSTSSTGNHTTTYSLTCAQQ